MRRARIGKVFNGTMHRNAEIAMAKVRLPNVRPMGFDKYEAHPGDWLTWCYPQEDGSDGVAEYGRVLGKIVSCDSDGDDCTGWIAVLWLHVGLSHASVMWVNPEWVRRCAPPAPELLAFVAGVNITPENVEKIDRAASYGSLSEHHIADGRKRFGL